MPAQPHRPAPVLSIINMKGGVGKTTIAANVFREVYRRKRKRVLLVDLDPQFNLSQLLLTRDCYDHLKSQGKTLYSVMEPAAPTSVFHVAGDSFLDPGDVDDYTFRLNVAVAHPEIELRLLPGDFRLASTNLRERADSLRIARKRFENLIKSARNAYDLVVIDCNPSTSHLTRCALESSTHLIVPIRPDRYSLLGAEMLSDFVAYLPTLSQEPERMFLLNGLSSSPSTAEQIAVSQLRSSSIYGPLTITAEVPKSDVLTARLDYTGFAVDRRVAWSNGVRFKLGQVADEISQRLGFK